MACICPAQGHDDFAGLDLKGKIVVVHQRRPRRHSPARSSPTPASTAPSNWPSWARWASSRLTTPKQVEIPWARQKLLARQPGMYLADAKLRDTPDGFFTASIDPEKSEALFEGTGHSFAELCALADASKPLPLFRPAQVAEGQHRGEARTG